MAPCFDSPQTFSERTPPLSLLRKIITLDVRGFLWKQGRYGILYPVCHELEYKSPCWFRGAWIQGKLERSKPPEILGKFHESVLFNHNHSKHQKPKQKPNKQTKQNKTPADINIIPTLTKIQFRSFNLLQWIIYFHYFIRLQIKIRRHIDDHQLYPMNEVMYGI